MKDKLHLIFVKSVMEMLYLIFPLCSLHIFTRIIPSGNIEAIYGIAIPVLVTIVYLYWLNSHIKGLMLKFKSLNYKIELVWSVIFLSLLTLLHPVIFGFSVALTGVVFFIGCFTIQNNDLYLRNSILHTFSFLGMFLGVTLIILGYGSIGTLIAANVIYSKVFRTFLDLPLMLYHFIYNERGEVCNK